jgi:hypothetical protein
VMRCLGGEVNGVCVSLSGIVWMFTNLGEHGNAFIVRPLSSDAADGCDVALAVMIVDGTGTGVWRFDSAERRIVLDEINRAVSRRARCWAPVS